MMKKSYYFETPKLKVCEFSIEQKGGAYIAFEEYLNIPGLENADISLQFDSHPSLEEVENIVQILNAHKLRFVVSK